MNFFWLKYFLKSYILTAYISYLNYIQRHKYLFACPLNHFSLNNLQGVEGRNVLLTEEIEAIRSGLQQLHTNPKRFPKDICLPQVDSVPEELFRRYV